MDDESYNEYQNNEQIEDSINDNDTDQDHDGVNCFDDPVFDNFDEVFENVPDY